jgi:hypothetical protein
VTTAMVTAATAPVTRRVRAYFAPVNRATGVPTVFDAAQLGRFALDAPPAPWVDLGWVHGFARRAGTKVGVLRAGAPAMPAAQTRTEIEATVSLEFEVWGKLQVALASGSQQMNLLQVASGAAGNGSGGVSAAATALSADSTATALNVGAEAAAAFTVGDLVAVDADYIAQTGYVGAGVSAAYVRTAAAVGSDINYIRRVTLNVGVVAGIAAGVLTLGSALPAGVPAAAMQVSRLVGFCDREGGSFFQEWSAVFAIDGEQGDRVIFYYPRLQAMQGSAETAAAIAAPLERVRLAGAFRALPVVDANDGESVLCFRSYLPGALRGV